MSISYKSDWRKIANNCGRQCQRCWNPHPLVSPFSIFVDGLTKKLNLLCITNLFICVHLSFFSTSACLIRGSTSLGINMPPFKTTNITTKTCMNHNIIGSTNKKKTYPRHCTTFCGKAEYTWMYTDSINLKLISSVEA